MFDSKTDHLNWAYVGRWYCDVRTSGFHTSLSALHVLLLCLCWPYQNWSLISLDLHLVTLHPLLGIAFPQIFYCATQTMFLRNIWKCFCLIPPDWLSSSASVAPHISIVYYFERLWTLKIGGFSEFLWFLAAAHTSRVNCDEMAGDRRKQSANRNCLNCRASHELFSNYLFKSLTVENSTVWTYSDHCF